MVISVDVVIPVYNGARDLPALLDALRAQRDVQSRVWVVDNGSEDSSARIAGDAALPGGVLFESVRSSYAARNTGISAGTAPYVAFTDSDCVPNDDWLARAVSCLELHGWDACAGQVRQLPGRTISGKYDAAVYLDQAGFVANMHFGATANLVVRREAFRSVGHFRGELASGGDLEFGRRLRNRGLTLGYCAGAVVMHHPREGFRANVRKSWRIGRGHAVLARSDRELRSWAVSPRRLLPDHAALRAVSWRPHLVAVGSTLAAVEYSATLWSLRVRRES